MPHIKLPVELRGIHGPIAAWSAGPALGAALVIALAVYGSIWRSTDKIYTRLPFVYAAVLVVGVGLSSPFTSTTQGHLHNVDPRPEYLKDNRGGISRAIALRGVVPCAALGSTDERWLV